MVMHSKLRRIIVDRVDKELSKRNWTQADLAKRSGISPGHISNMLAENRRFYDSQIDRIATAFGIPVENFVSGMDEYPGHLPIIIEQYIKNPDFRMLCDAVYLVVTRFLSDRPSNPTEEVKEINCPTGRLAK